MLPLGLLQPEDGESVASSSFGRALLSLLEKKKKKKKKGPDLIFPGVNQDNNTETTGVTALGLRGYTEISSLLFIDHSEDPILAVLRSQPEKKGHFIKEINAWCGLL